MKDDSDRKKGFNNYMEKECFLDHLSEQLLRIKCFSEKLMQSLTPHFIQTIQTELLCDCSSFQSDICSQSQGKSISLRENENGKT